MSLTVVVDVVVYLYSLFNVRRTGREIEPDLNTLTHQHHLSVSFLIHLSLSHVSYCSLIIIITATIIQRATAEKCIEKRT